MDLMQNRNSQFISLGVHDQVAAIGYILDGRE